MPSYLFRCPRCTTERDHGSPSGVVWCPNCAELHNALTPMKRVYQTGIGKVDGAGGSPSRPS